MHKLEQFVRESTTFNSFVFIGHYDMKIDHFMALYKHYNETGENLLDAYSNFMYLYWDAENKDDDTISPINFAKQQSYLSKLRKLRIVNPDNLKVARNELRGQLRRYYFYEDKEIEERRREACIYTARKEVKNYIIEKYGWECVKCGTKENISIDHITPVAKGGKDEYENMQPLCKSCNSKKNVMDNHKFMNHV